MKSKLLLLTILLLPFFINAQNVGIGIANPTNKLTVSGNLLITQPVTSSNTPPTVAQTKTMVNGNSAIYLTTDSTGRFYDPGGPAGNYLANLSSTISINGDIDNSGIQVIVESMDLGNGDSLIISDGAGNRLMALGNGYTTTGTYTFAPFTHTLLFQFKSNGDASVGAGFSILWKSLAGVEQPAVTNYTANALLFDVNKSAFRTGTISSQYIGIFSTAMGENAIASGYSSTAFGSGQAMESYSIASGNSTHATGYISTAMGDGTTASATAATSIGSHTIAGGGISFAAGNGSISSGFISTALGSGTTASGTAATSMGSGTIASGNASTSMGLATTARSYASLAIGAYNDSITGSSASAWIATDPLFYIGNSLNSSARHNALVIYKNGDADMNGYVRLGESTDGSPRIKIKKLTVNTPGSQGGFNFVAHGITQSKILAVSALATVPGGYKILPNHQQPGFKYTVNVDNANIAVGTVLNDSGSILNAPVVILVTYEE